MRFFLWKFQVWDLNEFRGFMGRQKSAKVLREIPLSSIWTSHIIQKVLSYFAISLNSQGKSIRKEGWTNFVFPCSEWALIYPFFVLARNIYPFLREYTALIVTDSNWDLGKCGREALPSVVTGNKIQEKEKFVIKYISNVNFPPCIPRKC